MNLKWLADVERKEWPALIGSFAYFFCLLCGYYIVRPVREEIGIQLGAAMLPSLFTAVFFVMLALTPIYGWLVARVPRIKLLPYLYAFFILNLLVFWWLFKDGGHSREVGQVFYVWVTVFNVFAVSVFWSFMVDIWVEGQSKRLFGIIAAGGTLGALAGPALVGTLVKQLGVPNLIPLSTLFIAGCLASIIYLANWAQTHGQARVEQDKALGGGMLDGLKLVFSKQHLIWMCVYLLVMTIVGTLMYFEQQRLVAKAFSSSAERTQYFAFVDFVTNAVVLVIEIFFLSHILKRFGLLPGLLALPVLTIVGFLWLSVSPMLFVVATLLVARRAAEYALAKPTREVLFTVLSKDEKYKAKNVIDTLVHRFGDMCGAWLSNGLKSVAPSTGEVALLMTPLGVLGLFVAWQLSRKHKALVAEQPADSSKT